MPTAEVERLAAEVTDLVAARSRHAAKVAERRQAVRETTQSTIPGAATQAATALSLVGSGAAELSEREARARVAWLTLAVEPLVDELVTIHDRIVAARAAIVPAHTSAEVHLLQGTAGQVLGKLDSAVASLRSEWRSTAVPTARRAAGPTLDEGA